MVCDPVCLHVPCSIVITKLDILDTFKEIKIGVSYTLDGKPVESMPGEGSTMVMCGSDTPSTHKHTAMK